MKHPFTPLLTNRATLWRLLLALMTLGAPVWLATPVLGTDRHWTGAINGNWTAPGNWNPAGMPQNGDNLYFDGSNDSNRSMLNDMSGLTVSNLWFGTHNSNDYQVGGNTVTVAQEIFINPAGSSTVTINCPLIFHAGGNVDASPVSDGEVTQNTANLYLNGSITVDGGQLTISAERAVTITGFGAGSNGRIHVSGLLSGSGDVLVDSGWRGVGLPDDDDVIEFIGTADNTLQGTLYLYTYGNSQILFNNSSGVVVTNRLAVRNGDTASLNFSRPNQIGGNATVLITSGSKLFLSGNNATVGWLVLTNYSADALVSTLDTGGTTLGLNGGITSWEYNANLNTVIKGTLSLNGFLPFDINGAGPGQSMDLLATIEGNGFQKVGNGTVRLAGHNTFFGDVEVSAGTIEAASNDAFGQAGPTYGVHLDGGSIVLRGVAVGAEPLFVNSAASFLTAYDQCSWAGPLSLNADLNVIPVDIYSSGAVMNFSGPISGSGGLNLLPALLANGTVELSGTSGNTFTGTTTVNCQLLELNKPSGVNACAGPLVVGGAAGSAIREARWLNSYQDVGATLTLYSNGYVNLTNHNEDFGPVTFNGGTVDSGPSGQFAIYAPLTVNPTNVSAVINGKLGLPAGADRIFNVGDGAADCDLIVNALIFGDAPHFVKQGAGTMCLTAANSFSGVTLLQAGILDVNNGAALSGGGIVVSGGATLRLEGSGALPNNFEMVGAGVGGTHGAIEVSAGGNYYLSGNILLDAATTLNIGFGGVLHPLGVISSLGTSPLTKTGAGSLNLGGAANNTYSGDTIVSAGTLLLLETTGLIMVPGNLVIGPASAGSPATVRLLNSGGIGGTTVTVNANSLLDLNGFILSLAQLNLNDGGSVQTGTGLLGFNVGGQVQVGSGSHVSSSLTGNVGISPHDLLTFTVGPYATSYPYDSRPELDVSAVVLVNGIEFGRLPPAGIIKAGAGRMRLGANNTYKGTTYVNAGKLQADGVQPQSLMAVASGAQLQGVGAVGEVSLTGSSATLAPGNGPGMLTCSNLDNTGGTGILQVELNGPTAGSGYDQLNVNGSVTLSGIALNASLNYTSAVNDQFTIIANDGSDAITGTFNGLPQNAKLYIGGQVFRISYTGGSGNDVVLTRLVTPPPPTLTIQDISPAAVRLVWPTNDPPFSLQVCTNLVAANWTNATPLPVVLGTNDVVTNAVSGKQAHYRLSNP